MEIEKFKHKVSVKVRFSDLDAMGHVNNATYLSYLEEARIAYYNDVMMKKPGSLDFNAVVARIEIDYVSQIRLGDMVDIYSRTSKIGTKSSDLEHLIVVLKKGEKVLAAKAVTKLVSFDYKKNQSVPVSAEARTVIENYESGNV